MSPQFLTGAMLLVTLLVLVAGLLLLALVIASWRRGLRDDGPPRDEPPPVDAWREAGRRLGSPGHGPPAD